MFQKLSTVGMECSKPDDSRLICLPKIESLTKIPPELSADRLDFTLYLPFDFVKPPSRTVFEGKYYQSLLFLFDQYCQSDKLNQQ